MTFTFTDNYHCHTFQSWLSQLQYWNSFCIYFPLIFQWDHLMRHWPPFNATLTHVYWTLTHVYWTLTHVQCGTDPRLTKFECWAAFQAKLLSSLVLKMRVFKIKWCVSNLKKSSKVNSTVCVTAPCMIISLPANGWADWVYDLASLVTRSAANCWAEWVYDLASFVTRSAARWDSSWHPGLPNIALLICRLLAEIYVTNV